MGACARLGDNAVGVWLVSTTSPTYPPELLDFCEGEVNAENALDVTTGLRDVVGLLAVRKLLAGIGRVLEPGLRGETAQTGCGGIVLCVVQLVHAGVRESVAFKEAVAEACSGSLTGGSKGKLLTGCCDAFA